MYPSWATDDWLERNGLLDDVSERKRLEEVFKKFPDFADLGDNHGVLLKSAILKVQNDNNLITPFDEANLEPASYKLTVGAAVKKAKDKVMYLRNRDDQFTIEPYEAVHIQTEETLNIPLNLIARWNISVKQANKGLIWAGAPQVNPGWQGRLSPPIFNLSSEPVTLRRGEKFATMDFVTTTMFTEGIDKRTPKDHVTIKHSKYSPIITALSSFKEEMDQVQKEQRGQERRQATGFALVLTMLTILVATLAAIVGVMGDIEPVDLLFPTLQFWAILVVVIFLIVGGTFFIQKVFRK